MTWRSSRLEPELGMIGMAKDEPGIYYDINGNVVSEAIARAVGHDVVKNERIRFLSEKRKQLDDELRAEMLQAVGKSNPVLVEKDGFGVVELAHGRFNVVDLDHKPINPVPLTQEEAVRLFKLLTGDEAAPKTAEADTDE
ncbi:hypothetical protein I6F11_23395 [Ensifer sp. NBAIM29]|nr:hypothetical protein [Ensifer sp. NBAIM29]